MSGAGLLRERGLRQRRADIVEDDRPAEPQGGHLALAGRQFKSVTIIWTIYFLGDFFDPF